MPTHTLNHRQHYVQRVVNQFAVLCACILLNGLAYAQSDKCVAQGNLAATMLKNRESINEQLALQEFQRKATPVDYGVIRLSAVLAYHPRITDANIPKQAIETFCEKVTALPSRLAVIENAPFYPECIDWKYSRLVDNFRRSGDQPEAIKQSFIRQQKGTTHRDRLFNDYLALFVDLMFLEPVAKASPSQQQAFERATCSALLDLGKRAGL